MPGPSGACRSRSWIDSQRLVQFPVVAGEDPAIGILRSFYLLLQTIQLLTGESP
jgi:hypothetical protein